MKMETQWLVEKCSVDGKSNKNYKGIRKMLTLEQKIEELEAKGLTKKEIESQTQDLFDQVLNEELKEESTYIADINLTIKIDSKKKIEKLQSILDELEIKDITLSNELDATVLHADVTDLYEDN